MRTDLGGGGGGVQGEVPGTAHALHCFLLAALPNAVSAAGHLRLQNNPVLSSPTPPPPSPVPLCSKMVAASETHKNLIRGCLPYANVK